MLPILIGVHLLGGLRLIRVDNWFPHVVSNGGGSRPHWKSRNIVKNRIDSLLDLFLLVGGWLQLPAAEQERARALRNLDIFVFDLRGANLFVACRHCL